MSSAYPVIPKPLFTPQYDLTVLLQPGNNKIYLHCLWKQRIGTETTGFTLYEMVNTIEMSSKEHFMKGMRH